MQDIGKIKRFENKEFITKQPEQGRLICNFKIAHNKPPSFRIKVHKKASQAVKEMCFIARNSMSAFEFQIIRYFGLRIPIFRNSVIYRCYCKVLNRYQLRNASHRARLSGFGRELFKNLTFIDSNFIAYFRAVFLEHYHVPLQTLEKMKDKIL